eukprot:3012924-Rhodomonas_salina.1
MKASHSCAIPQVPNERGIAKRQEHSPYGGWLPGYSCTRATRAHTTAAGTTITTITTPTTTFLENSGRAR